MSSCPSPSDYPESIDYVVPQVVRLYQRREKINFEFSINTSLPEGTIYLAYVNTTIISRDAKPCCTNEYDISRNDLFEARSFAIIPVAPGVDYPGYDPLCGLEVNIYANIERDFTMPTQNLICPSTDLVEQRFDKTRYHFVRVSDNKKGLSVRVGSTVRVTDPVGPPRKVIYIFDYRHCSDFDTSAFHSNPDIRCGCYPYPAKATARYVKIPEGIYSVEDIEVIRI